MEMMFADSSKIPRYILSKENKLQELTPDMRLDCKTPMEGDFTVESDRELMGVLALMANLVSGRIDRGVSFSLMMTRDFLNEQNKSKTQDQRPTQTGHSGMPQGLPAAVGHSSMLLQAPADPQTWTHQD